MTDFEGWHLAVELALFLPKEEVCLLVYLLV